MFMSLLVCGGDGEGEVGGEGEKGEGENGEFGMGGGLM